MSWIDLHKASETAATEAEQALRHGNPSQAALLYAKAAENEQLALAQVDQTKQRTLGITAVSAVSLWFKASVYERAEQLAFSVLANPEMPNFAKATLRNLLHAIWTENAKKAANISFIPGQVFVSVKGGEIIAGGAPLDLVLEKVQTIQAMFYRTVEFVQDLPLRLRGGPPREIQESCRPWLFQAPPGSYQFAVAIQEPKQRDFFRQDVRPELLAHQFLEIVKATASEDHNDLENIVAKPEYRSAFLKLSRNLAPTGKSFDAIELRMATDETPVILTPDARTTINQTIKGGRSSPGPGIQQQLVGVLRAVDLEKDFLNVIDDNGQNTRVTGLGDAMDDVIGPMVNKPVAVQVIRRGTRLQLIDIELAE